VPADRIDAELVANKRRIRPLDLDAERRRYGDTTQGGVGISSPA